MERAIELNLDAEIRSFDEGELERWLEALEAMRQRANWARTHKEKRTKDSCFNGEQGVVERPMKHGLRRSVFKLC